MLQPMIVGLASARNQIRNQSQISLKGVFEEAHKPNVISIAENVPWIDFLGHV
jgi:hypothetical protein